MAMRNFWITVSIDGRKTRLTGGPLRKDGGFSLEVYMRESGRSVLAYSLGGFACLNGKLVLRATPGELGELGVDTSEGKGVVTVTAIR